MDDPAAGHSAPVTAAQVTEAEPPTGPPSSPPGRPAAPARPAPRKAGKAIFFAVAAVAIIAAAGWALLGSSFLVVRSIRVVGTGPAVSRAQVLAAAHIPAGLPLIRVDGTAVARQVDQITQVQSAQVSTQWPSTVTITLHLRTPVFAIVLPGGYGTLDKYGVIIGTSRRHPPHLPTLYVPGLPTALHGNPAVYSAATVLRELPRWVRRRVRSVSAPAAADVSLRLAGGVTVVWGDTSSAHVKARELTILMHTRSRLYNVSGPGTPVTKP